MTVASNLNSAEEQKSPGFRGLLRTYLKLYCDRSTVHGVRYLFDDDLNELERLCWTAIVLVSIVLTLGSFLILSQRYNDQLLLTVVDDSQYPVFNVIFPSVALCTQKRINLKRMDEAITEFLPANTSKETVQVFRNFVERMETLRFGTFNLFSGMADLDLEKLNFVNVSHLAKFLAFQCEEIFDGGCAWRKDMHSCCDIFIREKTEAGFCLVFNSAISNKSTNKLVGDSFYPWRNSKSGEDTGLRFRLKLNATSNSTDNDGVFIMIKKSQQWSDVVYSIKGNTDTLVVIRPELTVTDNNAVEIPAEIRGCLFNGESDHYLYKSIKGLRYQQWNCFNVCHEEYILKYCNCTVSMFFPFNATYRECAPVDFMCLYKYRDVFSFDKRLNEEKFVKNIQGGMVCPCLISCDALEHFVTVSTLPISNHESNDYKAIHIDVHYQSEVMVKYRTSREFTYLELIASFGGIIGLFLGASIVSCIEIIYHLTFGLYIFLKDNHCLDHLVERFRKFFKNFYQNRISSGTSSSLSTTKRTWYPPANRRRY